VGGLEKPDRLAGPPSGKHTQFMPAHSGRIAPSPGSASAVAVLSVYECESDGPRVAIPRPEVQLVARFGATARGGVDVHALGVRETAHRKVLRTGQRAITARLRLGAQHVVLGIPAAAIAGRIVALEELWGDAETRRLLERLADARDMVQAAAILDSAIAERLRLAAAQGTRTGLAIDAADRLRRANVGAVAADLGVSERHLRRVFRETVGVSPKVFAKLARFRRALQAARVEGQASWANVAAHAGYYDQAHLIAEFRAIAGVTPRVLLAELRDTPYLD
jgi:AraC-like DNA-binding protein